MTVAVVSMRSSVDGAYVEAQGQTNDHKSSSVIGYIDEWDARFMKEITRSDFLSTK
jgi:hypothetical protein